MSFRFGKRKDDKSKDATKMSKHKLEALSEEELDRLPNSRDGYGSEAGGTRQKVSKEEDFCSTERC